jgi:hypothetical protein
LERAAAEARQDAHEVLSGELLEFLNGSDIGAKPNWYLQVLRNLVNALMANQACSTYVTELAAIMRKVNQAQRQKKSGKE